ncbi:ABC transporter ATP-binding protein [Alkalinema sp. FACHB-956]|uniref:ABC transporter ATP-binding protein n=1 Tax=Alkalinema sp. FACHB-956 TaxID=2692768 RepID=UPI001686B3A3|nr:ABC transporter ATP-binding protein [Alkalinema sp. FACHB-956]MBD2326221.1 ABC transporter ATP-binding protein [Alkalinema sp. FACHB-956]
MTTAISIQNLQKRYGDVTAVQDISLEIQSGEIFGILGPNGAGKTTTLRCLCTLMQPDAGTIEVMGFSALHQPRAVRQKLGYVAQEVALDKLLTGRELLELQAALYHLPPAQIADRVNEVLALLGLDEWADRLIGSYSGGLKKRLDLAAGLLHRPEVLVLDEPTVGLDIESRTVVWQFLQQLQQQGMTIVLTSHYLEEVDALANRVAILDRGIVIAADTPTRLKHQLGGDRITLKLREFTAIAEAEQAQALLTTLPWIHSVVINAGQGNSLNLVVDSRPDALALVQSTLHQAGLPLFSLAQSKPSLDDVYLAATGQTLMDAELAAIGRRDPKAERKQAMRR